MVSKAIINRLRDLELARTDGGAEVDPVVVGFVSPDGSLVGSAVWDGYKWSETDKAPSAYIAEALSPVILRPKRFIVLIGGRGSGKSIAAGDIGLIGMHDAGLNLMCVREFQSSITDSVHSLLKSEVERLELSGADVTDRSIAFPHNRTYAKFSGLARNPESVKSAHGFGCWLIEEAQFLSDKSLRVLTPTARNKPKKGLPGKQEEVDVDEADFSGVRMIFCGNPASSEDPFSQRFIVPFQESLDRDGIYEDDMHLIIKINFYDNPWFQESGLEQERQFDLEHLPRSTYDWVWNGGFNDEIENSLVKAEWFDACIDAHEKLGMKPFGVTKVSHDPSDRGADPKAVCVRKGNIITNVIQRVDLDVNEGSDWAISVAINEGADHYIWDVGGMGVTLKRDVNDALGGKGVGVHQFNGGGTVDDPDMIYDPSGASNMVVEKTNKEVCYNLRAQRYLRLRDRVYRTYRAVVHGEFCDPDRLISFSSACDDIRTLRAELCRMPIKPRSDGRFELYTKPEMRSKFKVRSPNLADCVMMTEGECEMISNDHIPHYIPRSTRY